MLKNTKRRVISQIKIILESWVRSLIIIRQIQVLSKSNNTSHAAMAVSSECVPIIQTAGRIRILSERIVVENEAQPGIVFLSIAP